MTGTTNICTWLYNDRPGEESKYLQVVGKSSSPSFLIPYLRCLVIFYASSIRHNPDSKHILFTNLEQMPIIEGLDLNDFLSEHQIEVVNLPLTYQVPANYHGAWRNQFYIFDILEYISSTSLSAQDSYLILDSDCTWIKSADIIWENIRKYGLLTYDLEISEDFVINGLSRIDMKKIFEDLGQASIDPVPTYCGGEWFGANTSEIIRIASEAKHVWQEMMTRFKQGRPKFNEEAHLLSYLYHKFGYAVGTANPYIRQIWTARRCHTAKNEDFNLSIWHLPAEKLYGYKRLFKEVKNLNSLFWTLPAGDPFARYVANYLGMPKRNMNKLMLDVADYGVTWVRRNLVMR
jgi:hypothetical protein